MPVIHPHNARQARPVRASATHTLRTIQRPHASPDASDPTGVFDDVDLPFPTHPPAWDGSDHVDVTPEGDPESARTLGKADPEVDTVMAHFWRRAPFFSAQFCRGTGARASDHPWAAARPLDAVHGPDGPADAAQPLARCDAAGSPPGGGPCRPVRAQRLPHWPPGKTTGRRCSG